MLQWYFIKISSWGILLVAGLPHELSKYQSLCLYEQLEFVALKFSVFQHVYTQAAYTSHFFQITVSEAELDIILQVCGSSVGMMAIDTKISR